MSDGQSCRHCGATDFYTGWMPRVWLPLGGLRSAKFRLRVCGQCGLTDWFVPRLNLERVRQTFEAQRNPLELNPTGRSR